MNAGWVGGWMGRWMDGGADEKEISRLRLWLWIKFAFFRTCRSRKCAQGKQGTLTGKVQMQISQGLFETFEMFLGCSFPRTLWFGNLVIAVLQSCSLAVFQSFNPSISQAFNLPFLAPPGYVGTWVDKVNEWIRLVDCRVESIWFDCDGWMGVWMDGLIQIQSVQMVYAAIPFPFPSQIHS